MLILLGDFKAHIGNSVAEGRECGEDKVLLLAMRLAIRALSCQPTHYHEHTLEPHLKLVSYQLRLIPNC